VTFFGEQVIGSAPTDAARRPHAAPQQPRGQAPAGRRLAFRRTIPESRLSPFFRPLCGPWLLFILSFGAIWIAAPTAATAAAPGEAGSSETILILQILALLVVGRLLGEAMLRLGQPAVMGQLIAGLLLGPSVFGALLPDLQHALFPAGKEQKAMLDALSQFGVLLLLLLTGMETDLKLVRQTGRAAVFASAFGIVVPFACGFTLGEFLPDTMLPDPDKRLITSLFLGTALSIASVKIVAMVVREMNFMRRVVGQVILASAIIDDSIGWIIVSIIFGIAIHGSVDPMSLAQSVIGTLVFLGASLTVGRRVVFFIIRWTNDTFVSEFAVITVILVIMGVMATITHLIGVHSVLGAFVAGILVGESPILTKHIDEQLRGIITAFFMPIFFGTAGLSADLTILKDPNIALLTAGLVLIASIGKFGGAFIGAELGGLTKREGFALACGMNARGSTEVIIATVGLSMGALTQDLFTMIVAMAVLTTLAMPPTLRWALSRVPLRKDEKARLEREELEKTGFVPNLERLLIAVDNSVNGKFAARLAGMIAGTHGMPTTIMQIKAEDHDADKRQSADKSNKSSDAEGDAQADARAQASAQADAEDAGRNVQGAAEATKRRQKATEQSDNPVDIITTVHQAPTTEIVANEARKGYDFLIIGLERTAGHDDEFHQQVSGLAAGFVGPLAVVDIRASSHLDRPLAGKLDILVPVNGTEPSRRAAEVAITVARATKAPITALYVAQRTAGKTHRSIRTRRNEEDILKGIVSMGETYGIAVKTAVLTNLDPDAAILKQVERRKHNLIIMGVGRRPGETLYFGETATSVQESAEASLVLVAS
jgi:Kef-type K+ transport system membrane component KefB/nucleotide-binding universal stress UspA family protein